MSLQVTEAHIGKVVKCPKCKQPTRIGAKVPAAAEASESSPGKSAKQVKGTAPLSKPARKREEAPAPLGNQQPPWDTAVAQQSQEELFPPATAPAEQEPLLATTASPPMPPPPVFPESAPPSASITSRWRPRNSGEKFYSLRILAWIHYFLGWIGVFITFVFVVIIGVPIISLAFRGEPGDFDSAVHGARIALIPLIGLFFWTLYCFVASALIRVLLAIELNTRQAAQR